EGGLSLVDGHARLTRLHVDAEDATGAGGDHTPRRLDLEGSVAPVPQMDEEGSRPQAQHDAIVAAVIASDVVQLGGAVEPEKGAARELELRATATVRPHAIAGQEEQVDRGLFRARLRRALDAHALFDVAHAAVAIGLREYGGRHGQGEDGDHPEAAHRSPHVNRSRHPSPMRAPRARPGEASRAKGSSGPLESLRTMVASWRCPSMNRAPPPGEQYPCPGAAMANSLMIRRFACPAHSRRCLSARPVVLGRTRPPV